MIFCVINYLKYNSFQNYRFGENSHYINIVPENRDSFPSSEIKTRYVSVKHSDIVKVELVSLFSGICDTLAESRCLHHGISIQSRTRAS